VVEELARLGTIGASPIDFKTQRRVKTAGKGRVDLQAVQASSIVYTVPLPGFMPGTAKNQGARGPISLIHAGLKATRLGLPFTISHVSGHVQHLTILLGALCHPAAALLAVQPDRFSDGCLAASFTNLLDHCLGNPGEEQGMVTGSELDFLIHGHIASKEPTYKYPTYPASLTQKMDSFVIFNGEYG
jgi:hypothetical protein